MSTPTDAIFPTIPVVSWDLAKPPHSKSYVEEKLEPYRTVRLRKILTTFVLTYRTRLKGLSPGDLLTLHIVGRLKKFTAVVEGYDEVNQDTNPNINYVFLEDQMVK